MSTWGALSYTDDTYYWVSVLPGGQEVFQLAGKDWEKVTVVGPFFIYRRRKDGQTVAQVSAVS